MLPKNKFEIYVKQYQSIYIEVFKKNVIKIYFK